MYKFNSSHADRHAFTVLEVLISIFILGTGILSVFSLFMAGRSLQAYYHRQNAAKSYVESTARGLSDEWLASALSWRNSAGTQVAFNPGAPPSGLEPDVYLIDPVGQNVDSNFGLLDSRRWNIAFPQENFPPVVDEDGVSRSALLVRAVSRVGLNLFFESEAFLNAYAGVDELSYEQSNPGNPDASFLIRSFYGGRQRRNNHHHHALFMTDSVADNAMLVFKDRTVPTKEFDGMESGLPLEMCLARRVYGDKPNESLADFKSDIIVNGSVIAIEGATVTGSPETVRRAIRPKQWAIIRAIEDNSFRFARVMSVIKDNNSYTLVFAENLEGDAQFGKVINDVNIDYGVECYFWSSLVHVAPYTTP